MSDWYSFPTYNPYSPNSPYVSNNSMMPTPNDIAAARLRTMGGGGGYRNDPTQFDQNAYAGRMAGLGALGATMAYPPLGLAAAGSQLVGPAGEADARTTNKDLEALRLNAQNQREAAKLKAEEDARARQHEIDLENDRRNSAAEASRQLNQWRADNAEGIQKLHPTWQDAIHGATTLEDAKDAYKQGQAQYKEASQTLAEKYPAWVQTAEAGAAATGLAIPALSKAMRAFGLWNAARKAENAYGEAFGPGATPGDTGALNMAQLRSNQLNRSVAANAPEGHIAAALGHPGEQVGATVAPWFFGNAAPNGYDYMMGSLSSDPGGQEKARKAWEHTWDPARGGYAATEGAAGGLIGNWLMGILPMTNLRARAAGAADTLNSPALQRAMRGANYPAQEAPMDLGGWSTPTLSPLYGGAANAVRKSKKYNTVLEGQ